MKNCFILIFLLLSVSSNAQISDSLKNYYTYKYKAIEAIINTNYIEANTNFIEAFKYHSPFSLDLINHAKVSSLACQYNDCEIAMTKLIKRGLPIDSAIKDSSMHAFFKDNIGKQFILKSKNIKKTYNFKLSKVLDSLLYIDQKFRLLPNHYNTYLDTICKIDSNNAVWMKKYFSQYGYPHDEYIKLNTFFSNYILQILIVHQANGNNCGKKTNFTIELYKALKYGNIQNETGAYLINRNTGVDKYGTEDGNLVQFKLLDKNNNILKRSNYMIYNLDTNKVKSFNVIRKSIGLCDIAIQKKTSYWSIVNAQFNLTEFKLFIWNNENENDYNSMLKNLIEYKN